jgi:DNA-binding Lrp family transcriptional regulator
MTYSQTVIEKTEKKTQTQTAYVLVGTERGSEAQILKHIRNIEEVEEAHIIYGIYDIIAKVQAKSMTILTETITKHIRKLDKVRTTLTLIVYPQPRNT